MRKNIFLVFVFAAIVFLFNQRTVLAQEAAGYSGEPDINAYGMLKRIPVETIMLVGVLAGMSLTSFCIALNLSCKIYDAKKNLMRNHFEKIAKRKKAEPNRPSPVSMVDNSPEIKN